MRISAIRRRLLSKSEIETPTWEIYLLLTTYRSGSLLRRDKNTPDRIYNLIPSKVFFLFRRQVLTWASAAAAVAIIFFSGNSWRQAQRFKGFGNEYYAALVEPVARDGNELDNLLSSSYALIGSGEYEAAMANLSDAKKIIDDGLGLPTVDEESEYEHKVLQEKLHDVDWYEAIILMKQGKYRKAKDALRTIAASESPYAENAKNILE